MLLMSRSDARSFEFCFDGIEQGSTVAVGMIGCKSSRIGFMRGYNEMLDRLQPEKINYHEYSNPGIENRGKAKPITLDLYEKYKKYFKGV